MLQDRVMQAVLLFGERRLVYACLELCCVCSAGWCVQVGFELEAHHPQAFTYCSIQIADRFETDIVQCLPHAFAFISQGVQDGEQQHFDAGQRSCTTNDCVAWLSDGAPQQH